MFNETHLDSSNDEDKIIERLLEVDDLVVDLLREENTEAVGGVSELGKGVAEVLLLLLRFVLAHDCARVSKVEPGVGEVCCE